MKQVVKWPLSKLQSARVPVVSGRVADASLPNISKVLTVINNDDFLKKNVIAVVLESEDAYKLKLRQGDFVVYLGAPNRIEKKFKNFKAFYSKAIKDKTLKQYDRINLEFKKPGGLHQTIIMEYSKYSVGLDIGTTKIVAIVGRENEYGKVEILGYGKSKSLECIVV